MSPAAATTDLLTAKRKDLLSLSNQKQSLELEVNAIISELTAPITITTDDANTTTTAPPIGIDTPLVDSEGYPRSDIDIYRARTLRKRFHEIKTDYKVLEGRIERGLLELTALRDASSDDSSGEASKLESISLSNTTKVNEAEEIKARLAPKPKPKFDPVTGKWVVKSWDGSVAGVENGVTRKFEDLTHSSEGALASIAVTAGSGRVESSGVNSSAAQQQQGSSTSSQQGSSSSSTTATEQRSTPTIQTIALTPFAVIDQVFPNSPSQEAGIQEGDLLLRFGTVTADNHSGFTSIKRAIVTELSLASANEASISIAVRRTTAMLGGVAEMIRTEMFDLRPRPWAGQGLLGCHLQEYNE
mmetsp:Transcript_21862/g.43807  ORF Transcript_21862/g.43807 Transcript_21862/m.43807 type:complete len:358 (-) Transcript_21862:6-1079(-)